MPSLARRELVYLTGSDVTGGSEWLKGREVKHRRLKRYPYLTTLQNTSKVCHKLPLTQENQIKQRK